MKEFSNVPSVFLGIIAAVMAMGFFFELRENRVLYRQNHELSSQILEIMGKMNGLERGHALQDQELVETRQLARELREQILLAKASEVESYAPPGQAPQPYQARAFLGNDYLGSAWIVHAEIPGSGGQVPARFTPVVRLDENLKERFSTTKTNVVEKEIFRESTYYSQPYQFNNYGSWPYRYRSGRAPSAPSAPEAPGSPGYAPSNPPAVALPLPPVGGGIPWTPVIRHPQSVPAASGGFVAPSSGGRSQGSFRSSIP